MEKREARSVKQDFEVGYSDLLDGSPGRWPTCPEHGRRNGLLPGGGKWYPIFAAVPQLFSLVWFS